MRWLLVMTALAALGGPAGADMVDIEDPPIVTACPHAATWPLVLACFPQHGLTAMVVASLDDANLVVVTAVTGKTVSLQGYALYVHAGAGPWHLGGIQQAGGTVEDFSLLRLEHVGVRGYRFDLAASQPSSTSFDGVTSVAAVYRQILATFCNGSSYSCVTLIPRCEQLVRGQAINSFEGTITVHDANVLTLKGAGTTPGCSASGEYRF